MKYSYSIAAYIYGGICQFPEWPFSWPFFAAGTRIYSGLRFWLRGERSYSWRGLGRKRLIINAWRCW